VSCIQSLTSGQSSRGRDAMLAMAAVFVVACSGQKGGEATVASAPAGEVAAFAEQAHRQFAQMTARVYGPPNSRRASLASFTESEVNGVDVPENNDSQRLLAANHVDFGPQAWVWAEPGSAMWEEVSEFRPPRGPVNGRLVARVLIDRLRDDETYPQTYLDLKFARPNTVYCVRLVSPSGQNLDAYVIPSVNDDCPESQVTAPEFKLPVRRRQLGGHTEPAEYIEVARWGFGHLPGDINDRTLRRPAIEVSCASQWCTILPDLPNILPLSPEHIGKPDIPRNAQANVHGWHDNQVITVKGASNRPTPAFTASVVPHPDLGKKKTIDEFKTDWVPVGTVWFDAAANFSASKYAAKGFIAGANEVSLLYVGPNPRTDWDIKIHNSKGDTVLHGRIDRSDHTGKKMFGTLRWGWNDRDDDIWIRCAEGCCYASLF
jgi:hypothetical protein